MDLLLGGWQLTGIHVLQSGLALTATLGGVHRAQYRRRAARASEPGRRSGAAGVGAHDRALVQHRRVRGVQSGAAGVRQRRRRASCAGPGYANFDFTLAKNFHVDDRRYFQFRTEVFNAFNRANFGPPNIARDSSGFGQILTAAQCAHRAVRLEVLFLRSTSDLPCSENTNCASRCTKTTTARRHERIFRMSCRRAVVPSCSAPARPSAG